MSFEINGKLYEKSEVVAVSDKFRKREFVIEKTEARFLNGIYRTY